MAIVILFLMVSMFVLSYLAVDMAKVPDGEVVVFFCEDGVGCEGEVRVKWYVCIIIFMFDN